MAAMEAKMEEADAMKAEKNTAYDVLKDSKNSAEKIVAEMLVMKREDKPKSQLRRLVTEMFLNFVSLSQANRSILAEEDRIKSETQCAKAPVDFKTLHLHNLMYEKNRYLKAIEASKDFKSKYPDIELVSEEDFFTNAPEEIKGTTISNDSSHNLMLKRLNYELFQRKELCKLHEKLEQHKKDLQGKIANRKKFLSSLPSHLKSLKKASLPVHNQLGLQYAAKLKQQHSAELLPQPLYIIYSQFMAQKEAFGENIDLEIVGSMGDARCFASHRANKDNNGPSSTTNKDTSKMDDDIPEDDGQRSSKRPKKVPSKDSHDQAGLYEAHPLRVILHIYNDEEDSNPKPSEPLTLKFEYLLNLNTVCVGIEGGCDEAPENSSILCNLFPDDDGHELPRQSAKLIIGDAVKVFEEKRTSRPYKWAQHLAGIEFLPEVSPMITRSENRNIESSSRASVLPYRPKNLVQTVVKRIRSQMKAKMALV